METFGDENYVGIKEMTMDMKVTDSKVNSINRINCTLLARIENKNNRNKILELRNSCIELFHFV